MPIRTEWRRYYGRDWRERIRPRILARAGGRCERCAKPDRILVWVYTSETCGQYWTRHIHPLLQHWTYCLFGGGGSFFLSRTSIRKARAEGRLRRIRTVLTVAHLNHDPQDNRDENLAALCQWCHLNHDRAHHRNTRAARKDAARPLLLGAASEGGTDATMPNLRLHG